MPRFNRLLITGAAGNLGRELRRGLAPLATTLRLTDREEMEPAASHEEVVVADVGDLDAMLSVVDGCDAVVHFGAAPVEKPWEEILNSSIKGGYNVYEAARRHGVKRVVYASSIHAVGYVRREDGADTDTEHAPDTLYGLSKCFVEDLAKLYRARWNCELDLRSLKETLQMDILRCKTPELVRKEIWTHVLAYNLIRTIMAQAASGHDLIPRTISFKGAVQTLEGVCLRINSCFPEPADRRHLSTWMSFRDLIQLVERSLCAESVGYSVLYGISDNRERFFNNDKGRHIGYVPQDSAETYRAAVETKCPPGDPTDPAVHFAGGVFCNYGHPDDEPT